MDPSISSAQTSAWHAVSITEGWLTGEDGSLQIRRWKRKWRTQGSVGWTRDSPSQDHTPARRRCGRCCFSRCWLKTWHSSQLLEFRFAVNLRQHQGISLRRLRLLKVFPLLNAGILCRRLRMETPPGPGPQRPRPRGQSRQRKCRRYNRHPGD